MNHPRDERVLIVDDEPANVALLDAILKRAGYKDISSTTDPRDAAPLFRSSAPDIVLLDLAMPHLDGFQVMDMLRSTPYGDGTWVPILVLTADVSPETKKRALSSGASDFLTKPFDREEVLARVANLLYSRRLNLELAAHGQKLEEEVRARTEELRETEDRLFQAQKMEAIGQLAGGIAHDFNNLLAVIINYAILLLDDMADDDPRREEIEEIQRAGEKAAALTRQLLAFSRKEVVRHVVLDINDVVRDMEKLLRRTIGEDIDLTVDLNGGLHRSKLDPGQLEQVVVNLAVNGRDAMPGGGSLLIRSFNATLDDAFVAHHPGAVAGDYACIQVTDGGTGMSDEVKDHLFEPFFTTKERGLGTGMGLATVYGIVKQADGYIDVESDLGVGSTFTVYFPATSEEFEYPTSAVAGGRPRGAGETILLVEDEDGLRRLLERLLTRNGFEVLSAGAGGPALEVAGRNADRIRLLLTDVILPGMSGKELSRAVGDVCPGVPTIYMSGYTDQIIGDKNVLGDEVLLRKPFTEKELIEAIHDALSASRVQGAWS